MEFMRQSPSFQYVFGFLVSIWLAITAFSLVNITVFGNTSTSIQNTAYSAARLPHRCIDDYNCTSASLHINRRGWYIRFVVGMLAWISLAFQMVATSLLSQVCFP
jgi:hypothetical protein